MVPGVTAPISRSPQVRAASVSRPWIRVSFAADVSILAALAFSPNRTVKCTTAQGDSLTRAVYSMLSPPSSRTRMSCMASRTSVVYRSRGRYTRHDTKWASLSARRNSSARRREPRSMTDFPIATRSRAVRENSSERGTVWMMSSISWPGRLGSPCDSASASLTRREISGISSTLALPAVTVNWPMKRCSRAGPFGPALSRTTTIYG
ncbi:Uncharacterised protein [Mycobacteroides abscessus subsp. abscessus]|nr:Uncharacterised protein [Mycobacteroides abscessus subsp. abscessus]